MRRNSYLKRLIATVLSVAVMVSILPVEILAVDFRTVGEAENGELTQEAGETEEPVILYELEEEREIDTKYFQMSDGSRMAARYEMPVHFLSEEGEYEEYDNTLTETDSGSEEVTNNKSDQKVTLSKKIKQKKTVQIEVDGYQICWGFEKAEKSAIEIVETEEAVEASEEEQLLNVDNIIEEAWYREVYPDVDLQYLICPYGVKENIILKDRDAQHVFIQNYDIGKLTALQVDEKTIQLKTEEGEVLYTISAPVMEDAEGNICEEVSMAISKTNGNHISVTLTADEEWLECEDRAYPVTIDPLVEKEGTYDFKTDCYVTKSSTGTESINSGALHTYVGMTSNGTNRTFLKVTMPSLQSGDVITKAYLNLVAAANTVMGTGEYKIDAHKITADWTTSTVSFDYPHDSNVLDYALIPATDAYVYSWNITSCAKEWQVNGGNYGILLKGATESGIVGRRFYTYKNTADVLRPYVTVYYINTTGLNDYNSYKTYDYGTYGTLYLNEYSGNSTYIFNDVIVSRYLED